MWAGLIGGFIFILLQLILIVDFAHSLAEGWMEKYEENESRACYCGNFKRYSWNIVQFHKLFFPLSLFTLSMCVINSDKPNIQK